MDQVPDHSWCLLCAHTPGAHLLVYFHPKIFQSCAPRPLQNAEQNMVYGNNWIMHLEDKNLHFYVTLQIITQLAHFLQLNLKNWSSRTGALFSISGLRKYTLSEKTRIYSESNFNILRIICPVVIPKIVVHIFELCHLNYTLYSSSRS